MFRLTSLVAGALLAMSVAANAVTFNALGTFSIGGQSLTGTIDINGGLVTGAAFDVTGYAHFGNLFSQYDGGAGDWGLTMLNGVGNELHVHFTPWPALLEPLPAGVLNQGLIGNEGFSEIYGIGLLGTLTADSVSATPLPAALPLFAGGLGAIGLVGWRRKRKAAAIAA